jgi:hypothetical protein
VPREPGGGKVKGGTDMEFAVVADTGFVYLLKGFKDDFLRYNTVTRAWQVLPGPQTGSNRRWQRGSWLAYDSAGKFFAHKARCHELLKYDVAVNAWGAAPLPGMPRASSITGRRKKSKDGSDGDCHAGAIYALKGGNTQEFWKYSLAGDSWQELDTMPAGGSTGRRKRVWYGGDLASFGVGVFFALKGNKTLECWRYVERPVMGITSRPERDGVAATRAPARAAMVLSPNPVTGGRLALTIAGQVSGEGRVSVFDAAGRKRLCRREAMGSAGRLVLDVDRLPSGWYVLRFELGSTVTMHKFAVQAAGGSSPSR